VAGVGFLAGCGEYTPSTTEVVNCAAGQGPRDEVVKGLNSPEQRNILLENKGQTTILIYSQLGKYSVSFNDLTSHTAGQIVTEVGYDADVVAGSPDNNVFVDPSNSLTLACKNILSIYPAHPLHITAR